MISFSGNAKILLFNGPADLRKGFQGLSGLVENDFDTNLTSGAFFVFINKNRNRMKILYWDNDGLALWGKQLEKGTFMRKHLGKSILNRREFFMLLEGIIPKRLQTRYKIP